MILMAPIATVIMSMVLRQWSLIYSFFSWPQVVPPSPPAVHPNSDRITKWRITVYTSGGTGSTNNTGGRDRSITGSETGAHDRYRSEAKKIDHKMMKILVAKDCNIAT